MKHVPPFFLQDSLERRTQFKLVGKQWLRHFLNKRKRHSWKVEMHFIVFCAISVPQSQSLRPWAPPPNWAEVTYSWNLAFIKEIIFVGDVPKCYLHQTIFIKRGQRANLEKSCERSLFKNFFIDNRKFWKTVKPVFTDKVQVSLSITLIENDEMVTDDLKIAGIFNKYFANITQDLEITGPGAHL